MRFVGVSDTGSSYHGNVVQEIHIGSVRADVGQFQQRVQLKPDCIASVRTL